MATIAVIIPAYNEADNLPRLLNVLKDEKIDELVVVDDASTDGTAAVVQGAGVRLLRNDTSIGPGASRNLGVKETSSDYVAFFDADTLPTSGIINLLLDPLKKNPEASAAVGVYSDRAIINTPFQRYRSRLSTIYHQTLNGNEIDIFLTAMGMVRKESFNKAGGFDTIYKGADIEDLEFGDRLSKIGPILLVREAEVGHVYPEFFHNIRLYYKRASMFANRATQKKSFDRYQVTRRLAAMRVFGALTVFTLPLLIISSTFSLPILFGLAYIISGWPVLTRLFTDTSITEGLRRVGYDLALSIASTLGAFLGIIKSVFSRGRFIFEESSSD